MPTSIIHISDTHFGDPSPTYDRETIKRALIRKINEINSEKILIISGDITYKSSQQGYRDAERFFSEVIDACKISRSNIVSCPGNHDIASSGEPFKEFDRFIYTLRRDNAIEFAKNSSSLLTIHDICFLLVNSAAHLDHRYGIIPDSVFSLLDQNTTTLQRCTSKIAITHHHLIGQELNDTSTTRNSYRFLYHLDQLGFNYILHGHQHSKLDLVVGQNKIRILSARSMSYHGRGLNNGITIVDLESGAATPVIWTADEIPGSLTTGVIK
ncbi:metallophosphoesterase family protein [Pseudomonas capsici]|uniref:Metallophosphoesterase n=1 Tax=Pseudomonas capsici TaxID=2810614 RepID=A0ABT3C3B8_9PSED|nr:metallophosphoesterase [Pseudomonas capsici]MCV4270454.1 metallophosphoesterase [Pseudomonas capsici]MCV4280739.1 metallophosphoesterase [Pseudomonas capsici]MCV4334186.1 metallophosphoesterase [Pseudomonas capsici]MCV4379563.1 metallophosphoesterase [Pseudomonas capsici]